MYVYIYGSWLTMKGVKFVQYYPTTNMFLCSIKKTTYMAAAKLA